ALPANGLLGIDPGNGDRVRLPAATETGERGPPVSACEAERGDRQIVAVPANNQPAADIRVSLPGYRQQAGRRPYEAKPRPAAVRLQLRDPARPALLTVGCRIAPPDHRPPTLAGQPS